MALSNNKISGQRSFTLFYMIWLAAIGFITVMLRGSDLGILAVFVMLGILTVVIRHRTKESNSLKMICNFYEKAHRLNDLEMIQTDEHAYQKILEAVSELGNFDWVVLFLLDNEKQSFIATEAHGIKLGNFESIKFEQLCNKNGEIETDPNKLSFKLLQYVFKAYDFKGALAGATLTHDNAFYGSLLFGRYDEEPQKIILNWICFLTRFLSVFIITRCIRSWNSGRMRLQSVRHLSSESLIWQESFKKARCLELCRMLKA